MKFEQHRDVRSVGARRYVGSLVTNTVTISIHDLRDLMKEKDMAPAASIKNEELIITNIPHQEIVISWNGAAEFQRRPVRTHEEWVAAIEEHRCYVLGFMTCDLVIDDLVKTTHWARPEELDRKIIANILEGYALQREAIALLKRGCKPTPKEGGNYTQVKRASDIEHLRCGRCSACYYRPRYITDPDAPCPATACKGKLVSYGWVRKDGTKMHSHAYKCPLCAAGSGTTKEDEYLACSLCGQKSWGCIPVQVGVLCQACISTTKETPAAAEVERKCDAAHESNAFDCDADRQVKAAEEHASECKNPACWAKEETE